MPPARESASPGSVPPLLALGGLTLLAAVPRFAASLDSLWLDEIWSLHLASRIDSAWQVFTALHHDNNHYLNTLWLRALGPDASWLAYRLPALATGIATVFLAGWIEWRHGVRRGLLAASFFAVSYPFVHYASEARGYGPVVLAALAAFALLERHHRTGGWPSAVAFSLVAALGFLAHLTFLTVYLPLLAWSLWVAVARRLPMARSLRSLAAHLAPLGVLGFLVLVDVRYLARGGGPELPPLPGWLQSWAWTLGIPMAPAIGLVLGVAFAAVVLVGLRQRARQGDGSWVFFALALSLPLALLLGLRTGYAPPRYFLASLVFGLLLVSGGLASLLRRGRSLRLAAAGLILVVLVGNGWRVSRFLSDGRGDYRAVVRHMAESTPGDTILVASDYDFGTSMVLGYYDMYLPRERHLSYLPETSPSRGRADWFLLHDLGDDFAPPEVLEVAGEPVTPPARYVLQRRFTKFGLSGWQWALYRRDAPDTDVPDAPTARAPRSPA